MAENGNKRILTAPQLLLAKLRFEGKLSVPEIHKECGISARQGARWYNYPEVQEEIARLGKAEVERAQRILERGSVMAAEALLELVDKNSWGKLFNQETCRKAACDILQGASVGSSKPTDGQGNVNVFNFGGLAKMFEGIDTGAIRSLLADLRNGGSPKGSPQVASRLSGTSDDQE